MIIAIDPGASGACVALDDEGQIVGHIPMPTYKAGKTTHVNAAALAGWIHSHRDASKVFVERVGAMPGQGVSSMFAFGHSAGVVEGVVGALGIPLVLVTPQAWKKAHGLIGKDKDEARTRAAQLYPWERTFDLKGKGQALADAVLIGLWGLKHAQ